MVTRVKKSVVAGMLLLVFTTAGFALSLAHDQVAPGFVLSPELGLGLSTNEPWHGEASPLQCGLPAEIGRVSSLIRSLAGTRLVRLVPAVRADSSVYARVYSQKIPLHLLDSILLI
jgi:hypothetical protein